MESIARIESKDREAELMERTVTRRVYSTPTRKPLPENWSKRVRAEPASRGGGGTNLHHTQCRRHSENACTEAVASAVASAGTG